MFPCPAACVFSFGKKSSSSNRSSRRVLCLTMSQSHLIVQTAVQKMVENYCFSSVSEGTLGSFWARFCRRSVLQGHFRATVFPCPAACAFSFSRKSSSSNRQQEGSMSHYVSLYKQRYKKWSKTIVFLGFQKGR